MRINQFMVFPVMILSVFFIYACGTTGAKKTSSPIEKTIPMISEGCNTIVTIKNYTHESDCQYLFETEDGTLFLPGAMENTNVPFYQGAGLKIGYEVLNKNANDVTEVSCKSHDYIIKVTCIEQYIIPKIGVPLTHEECKPIKNPYKFDWMRETITNLKPTRVQEYPYSTGYLYEFITDEGSHLYDCLGSEVCKTKDNSDCTSLIETLSKPKVILVVNN